MILQHPSLAALIAAGSLILGLSASRTAAETRYVWQESPSPAPPYTTWATAAHVIQQAVDTAQAGETVLVTNGVYAVGAVAVVPYESNRVALTMSVVLQSVNGPEVTIITGSTDWATGIRCVYVGTNAILSGFTLTNGHAGSGGGAWCEPSGTITNCVLSRNIASWGAGVHGGSLIRCILTGNEGGSVANAAALHNCSVTGNWGGGATECNLTNSLLADNRNIDGTGGASGCTVVNCTIVGNFSAHFTGGADNCVLYNSIVYYNQAQFGSNVENSTLYYSCTDVLPAGGFGNVAVEPAFVNHAAGDYRLRLDSPCIDAGTNLSAFLTTDLTGLPRPLDGNDDGVAQFDMGAYEFNPYRFAPTLQLSPEGFRFTVRGEPGKSVRIERSRDLVHWEFAGQVPIPASGQTLIDPAATTERQLFYRVIAVP